MLPYVWSLNRCIWLISRSRPTAGVTRMTQNTIDPECSHHMPSWSSATQHEKHLLIPQRKRSGQAEHGLPALQTYLMRFCRITTPVQMWDFNHFNRLSKALCLLFLMKCYDYECRLYYFHGRTLCSWRFVVIFITHGNWEHDHQPSCMPLYDIFITSVPRTIIVFQSSFSTLNCSSAPALFHRELKIVSNQIILSSPW